ncbi:hypothetical protein [Longispora albida]|uniref:hypothetical protein n=1 Tax=Longispora albida TaxID=203523 RepID=UPI000363E0FB|nr:hypothetical protein [Longispora albida]
MSAYPWGPGSATGIGSHPGTSFADALGLAFELPLPYLPELPARGPGADMLGRTAGLLVDLPVELYAARWQLTARPGKDARRTADFAERDLDTLTTTADGYEGPLKLQAAGPFTLASGLQLPIGGAVLRDRGAVRDLTDSLAEGLRRHVADVQARVPGAKPVIQLDEPSLPFVLAGRIPTESGFGFLRSVSAPDARDLLARLIEAVEVPVVVHSCAPDVPISLLHSAGAAAIAIDLALLDQLDPLGEALDAGLGLLAGVAPATSKGMAGQVSELWGKLGFPLKALADQVVVTPACGLAGSTPAEAARILRACKDAAARLTDVAHS